MKAISISERPLGKYSKYVSFSDSSIISETELAILANVWVSDFVGLSPVWMPKSKILVCIMVDDNRVIEQDGMFIPNPNYGLSVRQYFVPTILIKNAANVTIQSDLSLVEQRQNRSNPLIIS